VLKRESGGIGPTVLERGEPATGDLVRSRWAALSLSRPFGLQESSPPAKAAVRQEPAARAKLLVVELWGLGDLIIATPFLRAASEKYSVSLVAKPYARDLQERFWPGVRVVPFVAPWTAFRGKYHLWAWPWRELFRLRKLMAERFDLGLSARWDPRDHLLLWLLRTRRRLGFSRLRSQLFLTEPLTRPDPAAHRYENWRVLGQTLGLDLPAREQLPVAPRPQAGEVLLHTGAGQPVRVWPLDRYQELARRLRQQQYRVRVACDPDQRNWWLEAGEKEVATPRTVKELLALLERAGAFVGNDSGPSHLAAFFGVPTFTLFGPQLPEWFAPLHPAAEWLEGKPCPYKPCSDYCRFPVPYCMANLGAEEVWNRVAAFVAGRLRGAVPAKERQ
jgi:ADP-heptose:LPS heptosyltransferase